MQTGSAWVLSENNSSIENGEKNFGVCYLHGIDRENIIGKDDQVGELAWLDRSFDFFFEAGVGRAHGIRTYCFGDSDLLLWNPTAGMLAVERAAGDRGVDAHQRRHWRDVPIGPEGER